MLNYPVFIINKSQVKNGSCSKDGLNTHFGPPYINLKPNLCMKPNINILVIFSML